MTAQHIANTAVALTVVAGAALGAALRLAFESRRRRRAARAQAAWDEHVRQAMAMMARRRPQGDLDRRWP